MTPTARRPSEFRTRVPQDSDLWETCRLELPREEISLACCLLEAYDNEFLVRTETPGLGILRIWYPVTSRPQLDEVLVDLRREMPLQELHFGRGMEGLDEVYPDHENC